MKLKIRNIKKIKLNIKSKLIFSLLLLIILPIISLGIASYFKAKGTLQDNLKESIYEINNNITNGIISYLDVYKNSMILISKNIDLEQIRNHPEYEPYLLDVFKDYMESYEGVSQIYMGTIDGKFINYPHTDMAKDFDPRVRPWYQDAVKKQSVIFTQPYIGASTGKYQISCAAPVYENGDKNKLVGVVAVTIPLDKLSEKINNIKIGKNGYPYILDSNKKFITHKKSEWLGKEIPIPEIVKAIDKSPNGYVTYDWKEADGSISKKFSVYTRIPGVEWTVASAMYVDEIKNDTQGILYNALLIGIISLIIAAGIGIIFANKISNPIRKIVDNMNKVKEGDFTVKSEVKSNDEIGLLSNSFNIMVENVKNLLIDAKSVSEQVSNAATNLAATSEETSASAEEISRTVEEIARGASEQAADSEKGASIAGDLDIKFNSLAKNSESMFENANEVININKNGVIAVEDLKEKTNLNNESINKVETAINQLSQKSFDIGGILETIRSIAEQTNLLALNASIEAARAGDAGRGFAVVADEIRKLAEDSGHATDEIKSIVDAIQEESRNTVDIMNEVKHLSLDQTKSVEDVNKAFTSISKSVDTIANRIQDVNEHVVNLIKDKDSIVESIGNISAVSEETAAASEEVSASIQQQSMAVEEVAKSAEKLNELSFKLNEQINKFKI